MPVSRFLIPLVSTVWIFSVMGGMGMHVLAEQPTEVQAVRRQFSTLEEVTAVQVQEEGSTVRFLPGEGEEVCVRYADTTAEVMPLMTMPQKFSLSCGCAAAISASDFRAAIFAVCS